MPVELLDRGSIRFLNGVAEKLLQHAVLLLGGIAGQMERDYLV